ncbi:MAG: tyrosine-type recombinase/integrase [Acidiferrobacterales bacterium]
MARLTRDARLETREARSRLKQRHAPYWRQIHIGLSIGYRKGKKRGIWIARKLNGGDAYTFQRLGNADDHTDANDLDVLSYAQAHAKALGVSNQEADGGHPLRYTVSEAAEDYLVWFRAHRKSAATTEQTIKARILPAFGDRRIDSLTTAEINRWKSKLVTSPLHRRGNKLVETGGDPEALRKRKASVNRILTVFKALLNHAWRNNKVRDNTEWKRVKAFEEVDEARMIFLQPDQCRGLINAAQGAFRAYLQALLYTGARPGKELEFIQVQDFDRNDGTIRIPEGKTGARDVFLTDEGVEFFSRLTAGRKPDDFLLLNDNGKPWGTNHHARPMKAAVKAAKLPKATNCFAMRHTYISLALKNGMNVKVLADSVGTSIRMIDKYYAKFLHADRREMFNTALPKFDFKADNAKVIR